MRLELRQNPAVFPQVEPRVRVEVNRDGERGGDVSAHEPGLFRVLVAGGSPVECLALDQPTSWPGALERMLSTDPSLRRLGVRRVHVGNIGRSGIGSRQLDLIFERTLPQYRRLDAIVVMVGGNDVFHWLEAGAPATLDTVPAAVAETFGCHPEERFGWRAGRWAARALVRRLRQSWIRPLERREDAGAWVVAAREMRARATEVRTHVPDPAPMLSRFDRHLRQLLRRAQAHTDRVLVVRQPWFETGYTAEEAARFWHGGLGKAWRQKISVYYALDVVNRLMGLVDARAAEIAEECGLPHLDLRPLVTPSLEMYYDYVHYTPAGAAVVARAVADALLAPPAAVPHASLPGAVSRSATAEPAPRARPLREFA